MNYKLCYKKPSANRLHTFWITNSKGSALYQKQYFEGRTIYNRKTKRIVKNPKFKVLQIRKTAEKRLLRRCPF